MRAVRDQKGGRKTKKEQQKEPDSSENTQINFKRIELLQSQNEHLQKSLRNCLRSENEILNLVGEIDGVIDSFTDRVQHACKEAKSAGAESDSNSCWLFDVPSDLVQELKGIKSRIEDIRGNSGMKSSTEIYKNSDNPFIKTDYDDSLTVEMIIGKSDLTYLNMEAIHEIENQLSELAEKIILFENHLKESVYYSEEWSDLYKGCDFISTSISELLLPISQYGILIPRILHNSLPNNFVLPTAKEFIKKLAVPAVTKQKEAKDFIKNFLNSVNSELLLLTQENDNLKKENMMMKRCLKDKCKAKDNKIEDLTENYIKENERARSEMLNILYNYSDTYSVDSDKSKIPRELLKKFEEDEEKLKSMSKMIEDIENELKLAISSVKLPVI